MPLMWERLDVDEVPPVEDSTFLVAVSTMAPQYVPLYSHARELARYLLGKVEFRKFATLYSSALPAAVTIDQDDIARLQSNHFYSHEGKKRLILFAGDGSPFEHQMEYAHRILSFARELGSRRVISLGARWTESPAPPGSEMRVVGFSSDERGAGELEELGVGVIKAEPGPFFPNLVVGMAEEYGMRGYKIGVDHGEPLPHPRSVAAMLGVLSKMLGLAVDTSELVASAKEIERQGQEGSGLPEMKRERSGIYG
jgi:proteasome assembly chaperone (PAC2) family protein